MAAAMRAAEASDSALRALSSATWVAAAAAAEEEELEAESTLTCRYHEGNMFKVKGR
jgi:hypothetical protein